MCEAITSGELVSSGTAFELTTAAVMAGQHIGKLAAHDGVYTDEDIARRVTADRSSVQ